MKRIYLNCGQLGLTPPTSTTPHSSTHSCNKRPSRFMIFASSWLPNYASLNNTFIASASSSLGGSGPHSSSIYTSPLFVYFSQCFVRDSLYVSIYMISAYAISTKLNSLSKQRLIYLVTYIM